MRGHNDICLPACGSIRNTSVGCSCPGTGRQGNPFFVIENSFSSFIANDICASQESRSLEWRKCPDKFSFCLSSDLRLDIVSKMNTIQPSRPRRFGKGWERAQVHSTVDSQVQGSQGLPLSVSPGGHSSPPYLAPPLVFWSCCVINSKIKTPDTSVLATAQPDKLLLYVCCFLPSCCFEIISCPFGQLLHTENTNQLGF